MLRPLAAALLLALPVPARADTLQTRLVAAARANDTAGHAFRETVAIAGNAPGMDKAGKTYVNAYDPRRAPAERWRLVTVDGRAPTAKDLDRSRKTRREPPATYAKLADWLGGAATRADAAGGTVVYRFARLPAGTVKLGKHDASADTAAEVMVTGADGPAPQVRQIRFTATKGFRMMLVASVNTMVTTIGFRRLPDGAMVPTEVQSLIAGSMMGKSGDLRTNIAYADWQKVR